MPSAPPLPPAIAMPLPSWGGAFLSFGAFVLDAVPPMAMLATFVAVALALRGALLSRPSSPKPKHQKLRFEALGQARLFWVFLGLLASAFPAWRLPGLSTARGLAHGPWWGFDGSSPWAWAWWGPAGILLAFALVGLELRRRRERGLAMRHWGQDGPTAEAAASGAWPWDEKLVCLALLLWCCAWPPLLVWLGVQAVGCLRQRKAAGA